jgi:rubredoxin
VCTVCGYVYDESAGIPEGGIAPGTLWSDLPEDWTCPLCGAAKADFEKQSESSSSEVKKTIPLVESSSDMKEMSPLEISALCSNLARGCEKQYKAEEATLFRELGDFFKSVTGPALDPTPDQLIALIERDLAEGFPDANAVASSAVDRSALRALVWSEKVSRILKSLLIRYQKEGDSMIQHTGVYVCTICGFVYLGETPPEVCPVCKVPNWKFEKVEGR